MLQGMDLSQRIEFSVSTDKESPTVFVLKPLSGSEMLEMGTHIQGKELRLSGSYIFELLGKSITEIKNPDITDCAEINKFVNSLPPMALTEILTKITEVNKLSEQEIKN